MLDPPLQIRLKTSILCLVVRKVEEALVPIYDLIVVAIGHSVRLDRGCGTPAWSLLPSRIRNGNGAAI